jgi:hypothetical protein
MRPANLSGELQFLGPRLRLPGAKSINVLLGPNIVHRTVSFKLRRAVSGDVCRKNQAVVPQANPCTSTKYSKNILYGVTISPDKKYPIQI